MNKGKYDLFLIFDCYLNKNKKLNYFINNKLFDYQYIFIFYDLFYLCFK